MSTQTAFIPALDRPELLAVPTLALVNSLDPQAQAEVQVMEIDPDAAGGADFCRRYGYGFHETANCVLVEASRAGSAQFAACVVPPNTRADLNGVVRKHLGARRVSLLEKDRAIAETQMEYGSMTAVGLPTTWLVLVDARVAKAHNVIMGSGRVNAKLRLPGALFIDVTHAEVLTGLGR